MTLGLHPSARRAKAFSMVELLIVIAIIGVLLTMLLPALAMVQRTVKKSQCSWGLRQCHQMIMAYAGANRGYLPSFKYYEAIDWPVTVGGLPSNGINRVAEQLKSLGAKADLFTCPSSPAFQDSSNTHWQTWTNARTSGSDLLVDTDGYAFFSLPLSSKAYFKNGQQLADKQDSPGNPPLGCDLLVKRQMGNKYEGWYHYSNVSTDPNDPTTTEPPSGSGGGNTLFLDGHVTWFDWGDLLIGTNACAAQRPKVKNSAGVMVIPPDWEPMYPYNEGSGDEYFFGPEWKD